MTTAKQQIKAKPRGRVDLAMLPLQHQHSSSPLQTQQIPEQNVLGGEGVVKQVTQGPVHRRPRVMS